ncbi:NAD-dependent epimerase/dehydratase family protein [Patescibacteria group bacterium]
MKFKTILITGGCGFVGSNLALKIKENYPETEIITFDNLKRSGSELNVPRILDAGIKFVKGDVRFREQLVFKEKIDLIIECSAEPSVLAGVGESPLYVTDTNLGGTINCLELARQDQASFIFLSTSRVYPIAELSQIKYKEGKDRFLLSPSQDILGVSESGIKEDFPLGKIRTLYGATKLSSEHIINEFSNLYRIPSIINRCGVITGPWQFGKVDQGVIPLWIARHLYADKSLSYIGFGGEGKQVRDFLHVDDLFNVIDLEMSNFDKLNGETFNIGGGLENSLSLKEMTDLCHKITGNIIDINSIFKCREGDIPIYITDSSKFRNITGWKPKKFSEETFRDIYNWIIVNKEDLRHILN